MVGMDRSATKTIHLYHNTGRRIPRGHIQHQLLWSNINVDNEATRMTGIGWLLHMFSHPKIDTDNLKRTNQQEFEQPRAPSTLWRLEWRHQENWKLKHHWCRFTRKTMNTRYSNYSNPNKHSRSFHYKTSWATVLSLAWTFQSWRLETMLLYFCVFGQLRLAVGFSAHPGTLRLNRVETNRNLLLQIWNADV